MGNVAIPRRILVETADLADHFVWTRDRVDGFRILSAEFGQLKGDCDDFAATALWIAEGRSMLRFWWALLTFRAVMWTVKGKRWGSHAVLLWHVKYGWIDNQNPTWGQNRDVLRYPVPFPIVVIKMLIGRLTVLR